MPGASHAPNDWPAEPRSVKRIVPGGSPSMPCFLVTACESRPPTVRLTLRIGTSASTGMRVVDRRARELDQLPVERARQRRVLRVQCGGAAPRPARPAG